MQLSNETYGYECSVCQQWWPHECVELGMLQDAERSWDLSSVLEKLVDAASILLDDQKYDGHEHEEIAIARDQGREILKRVYRK
jgi:hypothetical protein